MKKRLGVVVSKLTGISTSFFGVSWQPSAREGDVVVKLLIYFEGKRSLGIDEYGLESHGPVIRPAWLSMSVMQIRDQATQSIQTMSLSRPAADVMNIMINSCNRFLSELEEIQNNPSYPHMFVRWQSEIASCIYSLCVNLQVFPGNRLRRLLEWRLPSNVRLVDLEKFSSY